jgi:hypothetical protein
MTTPGKRGGLVKSPPVCKLLLLSATVIGRLEVRIVYRCYVITAGVTIKSVPGRDTKHGFGGPPVRPLRMRAVPARTTVKAEADIES